MDKIKLSIINKLLAILIIMFFISCETKKWDEYYEKPDYVVAGNTFDVLSETSEYSDFVNLLKKAGYDSILKRSSVYTVLVPKNGSISGVDTENIPELKYVLGMHIIPSRIFKNKMDNSNTLAVSGKLVKFSVSGEEFSVNGIGLNAMDKITSNGIYHEVGGVIMPKQNLLEAAVSNPNLSKFKEFIDGSYESLIDPDNNVKIGFDTLNNPIYKEPINYIEISKYIENTGLQDESKLLTGFFPSNNFVDAIIDNMLPSRGGNIDLIAPRLDENHNDTIVAWRYFKSGETYAGDTAVLLNDVFRYLIADGLYPELSNTISSITGEQLNVGGDQVEADAQEVSNGLYYILNELNIPDHFYRKEYFFKPDNKIRDPNDPESFIVNPYIVYSGGSKYSKTYTKQYNSYTGKFTRFDFKKVGTTIDFIFPFVTEGDYDVEFSYFPESDHGLLDISYEDQLLIHDMEISRTYNSRALASVPTVIGRISVLDNGPVQIRFTCTNTNPYRFNKYTMGMDYLKLIPVDTP